MPVPFKKEKQSSDECFFMMSCPLMLVCNRVTICVPDLVVVKNCNSRMS